MNYEEALSYQKELEQYGSIYGLGGIRNLMEEFGNVQERLSIIHVAGTNGKGSVCSYLNSILTEAGYKAGQFSSPAVFGPRDAFRLGREQISEQEFAGLMQKLRLACDKITEKGNPHPTGFEVQTALAFLWFYSQKADFVILETGLGGKTDATNLIKKPFCCVLTSIGMDHMGILGETQEDIARAKAGILKEGVPAVSAHLEACAKKVFTERAEELHTVVHEVSAELLSGYFSREEQSRIFPAVYQKENASCAIGTIEIMREQGILIPDSIIKRGIEAMYWPGRFECIRTEPLFYIDGAHNAQAAQKLSETLQMHFTNRKIVYIIGILKDKEQEKILKRLLPLAESAYTVTPDNPRALPAVELAEEVQKAAEELDISITVKPEESVELAVRDALREADREKDTVIVAFGSLYYLDRVKIAAGRKDGQKNG